MKKDKTFQVYIFDEFGAERKLRTVIAKSVAHTLKIIKEKDKISSKKISDIIEI